MKQDFTSVTVGFLEVNCYIVPAEKDGCVYIIDPGACPEKIADSAEKFGSDDYRILLTHGHIDHISAVREVMNMLNVSTLYLHSDDLSLYRSPANELPPLMPALNNPPEPAAEIESCEFRIIHTPGHTMGGVCYYFENIRVLFSGDTLFRGSIGRTDLPEGDTRTLYSSIREKWFTLPENLQVFPGHGTSTIIGDEKRNAWY